MGNRLAQSPYGYLDEATGEFVITRPDTPTPWINYLGEGGYGGIVSNTGGGFSFDRDPRSRRVTRYRYNGVPADQPGRYIYVRLQETGEIWGATWQPVRAPLDSYECRHGAGYTRITTERSGVRAETLYFVPPGQLAEPCPVELWRLRLTNTGERRIRVRTFSYAELSFPDAMNDLHNLDWSAQVMATGYRSDLDAICAGMRFRSTTLLFASDRRSAGHDCDREAFTGRGGTLEAPEVVLRGEPGDRDAPRGNGVGCLCHDLSLDPGETAQTVYMLGITDTPEAIPATLARWSDPTAVEAAFAALRADWSDFLESFSVVTPDPEMNATLNVWNPVQCRTTLYWSRFVSAYETGLGRGMGTRDSAQDILGVVHAVPEWCAERLVRLWSLQFRDGHTWHQLFPLTGEGGLGLAAERPEWPSWFCDDHLWLVITTCAYVRETGDRSLLRREVAYQDGGRGDPSPEPGAALGGPGGAPPEIAGQPAAGAAPGEPDATLWGHMMAAIDFTLAHRGPHGLPRPGYADWDDTLNVDHGSGLAESVWCGMQLCRAALDVAALCEHLGREAEADRFRRLHAEMAAAINACAWDGDWYARAFDDAGRPIGVAAEERHRINLIPQSWSVIGEVASPERARRAMDAAHERLDTGWGPSLLWPPYDGGDPRVNGTSTYPPGAKENGGIFCHAAAWSIVAAAQMGDAARAHLYYRQLLPLSRADVEMAQTEPYVYSQNILGPAHPHHGLARNAWLTGAAAWTYVAATQWILGIRPTHGGLRVAPVIPDGWDGFTARRRFRGCRYEIAVRRRGPGSAVALRVDGRAVEGDLVPLPPPDVRRMVVDAILG